MLPGAPGHIAVPAVYSPSGGGSNEMYQEAEFFRGNEGKKISPWFCCTTIRWTEAQDLNDLKMVQKKLPAQSFFQSHWRFEPLSYLRVHITSLNSILLILAFCIAQHCFSRLTKHHRKTPHIFLSSLQFETSQVE